MTTDFLITLTLLSGISGLLLTVVAAICGLAGCKRDSDAVIYYALGCFGVFILALARLTHVI